jgi:quinol monooxygenase YgiN
MDGAYVQIATLEIDPARLDDYQAAVRQQITAAIEGEPGVLTLYAVADRDRPTQITVFEIYRDQAAYQEHLLAPHFLAYKATVEPMVKSLTLTRVAPIALAANPQP